MIQSERIAQLKTLIDEQLSPLITREYVLLDLPYYANIGDTLIWEGTRHFLSTLPHVQVGRGSSSTWLFPPLDQTTIILLLGGGNFGDLWLSAQAFRLEVINFYPENQIIILPQTVFYQHPEQMIEDANQMAKHPNLTICARESQSEALLRTHFKNKILCLPDMAFCIPRKLLKARITKSSTEALLLQRTDKELLTESEQTPEEINIRDWPTIERTGWATRMLYKLSGACDRLKCIPGTRWLRHILAWKANWVALRIVRPDNIRQGVHLLAPYRRIETTRLHGAILALLMGKEEIYMMDNSYGKNSAFYESWLKDTDGINMDLPLPSPQTDRHGRA